MSQPILHWRRYIRSTASQPPGAAELCVPGGTGVMTDAEWLTTPTRRQCSRWSAGGLRVNCGFGPVAFHAGSITCASAQNYPRQSRLPKDWRMGLIQRNVDHSTEITLCACLLPVKRRKDLCGRSRHVRRSRGGKPRTLQADLFRCVFGNPLVPLPLAHSSNAWGSKDIQQLARESMNTSSCHSACWTAPGLQY